MANGGHLILMVRSTVHHIDSDLVFSLNSRSSEVEEKCEFILTIRAVQLEYVCVFDSMDEHASCSIMVERSVALWYTERGRLMPNTGAHDKGQHDRNASASKHIAMLCNLSKVTPHACCCSAVKFQ